VTAQFNPFSLGRPVHSLRAAARLRDGSLKTYAEEYDALVATAMKNPDARDQIRKMFKTEMVKPHRHIVETK
jgi:hypothetical protein